MMANFRLGFISLSMFFTGLHPSFPQSLMLRLADSGTHDVIRLYLIRLPVRRRFSIPCHSTRCGLQHHAPTFFPDTAKARTPPTESLPYISQNMGMADSTCHAAETQTGSLTADQTFRMSEGAYLLAIWSGRLGRRTLRCVSIARDALLFCSERCARHAHFNLPADAGFSSSAASAFER